MINIELFTTISISKLSPNNQKWMHKEAKTETKFLKNLVKM